MSEITEKAFAALDAAGIEYDLIEHEPMFTMEQLDESGLNKEGEIAKNLFLRNDSGKQHYLVVIKEGKTADLKKIKEEIGCSRLSFASEERLMKHLGLKRGSVSPLGIINDEQRHVKVFFDRDLMEQARIGVHPNENTATVFMKPQTLFAFLAAHGNEIGLIEV